MKLDLVARGVCLLGESPRWHAAERCLYFVDKPRGALHRYAAERHEVVSRAADEVCACVVADDGSVLVAYTRGAIARFQGGAMRPWLDGFPGLADAELNDVVADPRGRLVCGAAPSSGGRLLLLDAEGQARILRDDLRAPNGIAFPADDRIVYADSRRKVLFQARYDAERGELGAPAELWRVPAGGGLPDGLAADEAGGVWCALWGGGGVVRLDAGGRQTHRVELPVRNVTAAAFGGEGLDALFVTTATSPADELGGSLFRAVPPHRGRAVALARSPA